MSKKCNVIDEILKKFISLYNDWNNFYDLKREALENQLKLNDMKGILSNVQGYYLSTVTIKQETRFVVKEWQHLSSFSDLIKYNKECKEHIDNAILACSMINSEDFSDIREALRSFRNNPSKRNFRHLYRLIWEAIAVMEKKKKEYDERIKIVAEQKELWEKLHDQIKQWYEGKEE